MSTITRQEFFDEYRPITNVFNQQADYNGCLMAANGQEYQRVLLIMQESPECVWTCLEGSDGLPVLNNGFTALNSKGYVVTEEAAEMFVEVVG
ncbi:hypothetical protein [Oceanobacter antarcticus]|uniref:Uncharacterized protein n=1 Tax=Oceanobacter antarcticus TaxID=3133425 RepID=A0ABW8NKV2_9GAMM